MSDGGQDPPSSRPRAEPRWRRTIFAPSQFLVSLILLLVALPFLDTLPHGKIIEITLTLIVFMSALLVVSDRRHAAAAFVIALVPLLVGACIYGLTLRAHYQSFLAASGLFFVGFAIVKLLNTVLHSHDVDFEVLAASVATYLCLAMLWSFGYTLIAQLVPGSFTFAPGSGNMETMKGFNSLYFSFCTLTTVGFGDIVPIAKVARLLVMTEATCGMFYMTILVARLVSIYSARPGTAD